jgi:hypothetical protein
VSGRCAAEISINVLTGRVEDHKVDMDLSETGVPARLLMMGQYKAWGASKNLSDAKDSVRCLNTVFLKITEVVVPLLEAVTSPSSESVSLTRA